MKKIFKPSILYYNDEFQKGKVVLVEDNKILKIDTLINIEREYGKIEIEEWNDEIMVPGTINTHNHSFQSLLRGIATDRPFLEWRDKSLYKFSPVLKSEDIYIGALFAFGEMLKYGVTTVCDFFYVHNEGKECDEAVIKAAKDVGIRLVLARTMYDWDGAPKGYVETIKQAVDNTKQLAIKYNNSDEMTTVVPAPHSLHAASIEMVKAGYNLAKELNTRFHIHVAEEPFEVEQVQKEYGLRPVELLNKIGVLDESMVAVHAVWLNEEEIKLMGKNKTNLAYCPSSNMFLADGVTNIPDMIKYGVNVGLGSDGACSNNRISIFEEIRMSALLQKVNRLDAMCINGQTTFKMGTEFGGKLLQLPIGKIEEGYKADFVSLRLNDISLQPLFKSNEQLLSNIVYSMQPTAISRVIVDGKEIVKDNEIVTVSEKNIIKKVNTLMDKLEKL